MGSRLDRMTRAALYATLHLAIGVAVLSGTAPADSLWSRKDSSSRDLLKADDAFRLIAAEREGKDLRVSWEIAPGYYLYRKRIKVQVLAPAAAKLDAPVLPKGELVADAEQGGNVEIYHGSLQAELHWSGNSPPQQLRVSYQGCAEAGVCYPPQTKLIDVIDLSHQAP
jgi:thiol:disulfide interchange protein DsbD